MKKILALILFLAFTTQTFSQAIILIDFYINQSYLAANKCENRFRPMLHCNGQCILAKKMRAEEQKDKQNPERKLENKNEVISSRSFFISSLVTGVLTHADYFISSDKRTTKRSFKIFHPPCA